MKEHNWHKKNMVGLTDNRGHIYDVWGCDFCGIEFRRYGLGWNPPPDECEGHASNQQGRGA